MAPSCSALDCSTLTATSLPVGLCSAKYTCRARSVSSAESERVGRARGKEARHAAGLGQLARAGPAGPPAGAPATAGPDGPVHARAASRRLARPRRKSPRHAASLQPRLVARRRFRQPQPRQPAVRRRCVAPWMTSLSPAAVTSPGRATGGWTPLPPGLGSA
eukprot:scaffold13281_cov119-Isochrysis_galbana.AAC.8